MSRATASLAGIVLVMAATSFLATLATTTQLVSACVLLLVALWFHYFFQVMATTAVVLPLRGFGVLRSAHPKFPCRRGACLTARDSRVLKLFRVRPAQS